MNGKLVLLSVCLFVGIKLVGLSLQAFALEFSASQTLANAIRFGGMAVLYAIVSWHLYYKIWPRS